MPKRHQPKPGPGHFHGSGQYVRRIINCLEKVNARSGYHAYQIFDDWSQLVEACLDALPAHLTALAQTGRLAEDSAETRQFFARIRSRYEQQNYRSSAAEIWSAFGQALAILLESAEPGLWGPGSYGNFDVGYMGPDVIGHTYQLYATPNQARAQIFTPWNIALMMGKFLVPDGERQVHDRLKQACQHPDNILAQATLLAGLAIDDPAEAQAWFFKRVLPAAILTYDPLRVGDPAGCGSGVLLLAAAACFPEWTVRLNCVVFEGSDIDPLCVRLAKINCMLYGLNGYALKLAEAARAVAEAQPNGQNDPVPPPKSVGTAIKQIVESHKQLPDQPPPSQELSFESLFRRTVQPAVVEERLV